MYDPIEYVIGEFNTHEIIFIGELHYIKEFTGFMKDIIPVLHENGINIFFTEFANYEDTYLIDSLINGKTFNDELARKISHNQYWQWAYQEYIDIYRAAWKLNKSIEDGKKFRIIGINNQKRYSEIQNSKDMQNPEKRIKYFNGTENEWAKRIIKIAVDKEEKAIVYCGGHHALSKYRQPYLINGQFGGLARADDRAGQNVFSKIGNKCMTIWFHSPWGSKYSYDDPFVKPLNGKLDSMIMSLPKEYQSFGFNTSVSDLGRLTDTCSIYGLGYSNFTLSTICDGYIVLGPTNSLTMIEPLKDFINQQNIDFTRIQAASNDLNELDVKQFNDRLVKWNHEYEQLFFSNIRDSHPLQEQEVIDKLIIK